MFGTGSGTMDPTRTTLLTEGNKPCSTVELIREFPVSKWTKSIRLEATEFNGNILTEVGISETTTNINTHAMIRCRRKSAHHRKDTGTNHRYLCHSVC